VRQLAVAFCPASLLAGVSTILSTLHIGFSSQPASWLGESGSKLPHSKASLRAPGWSEPFGTLRECGSNPIHMNIGKLRGDPVGVLKFAGRAAVG
jgi:hypothetical protein